MMSLQGIHCFIICFLRHCSVLGFDYLFLCLLCPYTIQGFQCFIICLLCHCTVLSFDCLFLCFVTSLCSLLIVSIVSLSVVTSVYFMVSIASLPICYVTTLFSRLRLFLPLFVIRHYLFRLFL